MKKLKTVKALFENELKMQVPVMLSNNLRIVPIKISLPEVTVVEAYQTDRYHLSGYHKPISKCMDKIQEMKES